MTTARRPRARPDEGVDLLPEHQLLLVAARTRLDDSQTVRLQELAVRDLDWSLVSRTAVRHGVAPLVFHTLSTTGAMSQTDPRAAALWERFAVNAGNSLMLARQLLDVLTLFERERIPAIAYKGPALAASLYGNLALREFTDLDLLVRPNDVRNAGEVMVRNGYEPELALSPVEEHALLQTRAGYFRRFDRSLAAGSVAFELHWRIPATFRLDQSFWLRRTAVRLLDRDVPHFAPDDLLLVLCVHGFKHGWRSLKWLCDVAELVDRYPSFDWDRAITQAARAGGLRILLLGCALARATFATALPLPIAERIEADPVVRELTETFRLRLFDEQSSHHVGVVNNLRVRERMHDRIRYGFALFDALTAPSVKDRLEWPVKRGARLVARVAHPFRVAHRVANKRRA